MALKLLQQGIAKPIQSANIPSTLPTIGAAIILLSLPLDGLFQRIVSYPVSAVPDPTKAVATVSRTVVYDPRPEYTWYNGTESLHKDLELDLFSSLFGQGLV